MGLKKARKFLCIIIAAVISFSTVCVIASATLDFCLANRGFFSKHLITNQIVEECNVQLEKKYEALEAESGIPLRVFEMAMETYDTRENLNLAASYIFSEESTELYSPERVDYFYNLCTEYLDGNSIKYNKAEVKAVAEKATKIYSDTVGIHNTDIVSQYLIDFSRNCAKAASIAIVSLIICVVLLIIIYNKKNDAYMYLACGISGGGIATALAALLALIFRIGTNVSVSPAVYQASMASMVRIYFMFLILIGAFIAVLGGLINFFLYKYVKREEDRQATRFNKIVAKL